jgi:hypothetical protein
MAQSKKRGIIYMLCMALTVLNISGITEIISVIRHRHDGSRDI